MMALSSAISCSMWAAPQLRLSQTVVGPLTVNQGSNPANQVVFASNVGDGTLNLRLTSNVSWLSAATSAPAECSLRGICTPINISIRTTGLSSGLYTGTVAVSDPNAVDAPQTIVVTVRVGTGLPEKIEFNLTPGASSQARLTTANPVNVAASVSGSTNWLAVAAEGGREFCLRQYISRSPQVPADWPRATIRARS